MEHIFTTGLIVVVIAVAAILLWPSQPREAPRRRARHRGTSAGGHWKQAIEDRGRHTR